MNISRYLSETYRRRMLDRIQQEYSHVYTGVVLDIGGRDRGGFQKPKERVEKWIFADIVKENNPDIVLDVADMPQIEDQSIDVINAIELFEHVKRIDEGLAECMRVLKPGGDMLIAVPFMKNVHGDPYDYQRWTNHKWQDVLSELGCKDINILPMGGILTQVAELLRYMIKKWKRPFKYLGYLLFPFCDLVYFYDMKFGKSRDYTTGYFIHCTK